MNPFITDLRALLDFYESRPDLKSPVGSTYLAYYFQSKEDIATFMRALGSCRKTYLGDQVYIEKKIGCFTITGSIQRNKVCRKVVIGTKTVPAQEAYTVQATEEYEEDIVKWVCDEGILDTGEQNESNG